MNLDKISDRPYKKFVILGMPRTGSNLLKSLLNNHEKISAQGEHFDFLGEKSGVEVFNKVFPPTSKKDAVGFKLFYNHPIDSSDTSIWNILLSDTTFKIIHLQRKNILRAFVSKHIADRSKQWIKTGYEDVMIDKSVRIPIENMINTFNLMERNIAMSNKMFRNHPLIEVFYKDLCTNRENTLLKIQNFLDIPQMPMESNLQKQNPEPLDKLIQNFHEVRQTLKGSKYESMLEG